MSSRKAAKRPVRALSRMELTVLGLVSRGEPCTAYWIRRQFQNSPSSHFSGSAGAVYPAVRRLEQQRLLRAVAQKDSGRNARGYSLTGNGKKALQQWLLPPLPADDIACLVDPVLYTVYYLDALSPRDRIRFVEDALARTRAYAAVVKADCDARKIAGEALQHLGARGVLHEVRARIRWLEELRREL